MNNPAPLPNGQAQTISSLQSHGGLHGVPAQSTAYTPEIKQFDVTFLLL